MYACGNPSVPPLAPNTTWLPSHPYPYTPHPPPNATTRTELEGLPVPLHVLPHLPHQPILHHLVPRRVVLWGGGGRSIDTRQSTAWIGRGEPHTPSICGVSHTRQVQLFFCFYLAGRGVVAVDGVDLGAARRVHARVQRCWLGWGVWGVKTVCVVWCAPRQQAGSLAVACSRTWVAVEDAHGPRLAAVEGAPHLGEDRAQRHRSVLLPRRARGGRGAGGDGGRAAGRVSAAGPMRVDCGCGLVVVTDGV